MKGTYNLEITGTDDCNFRCDYCFEDGCFSPQKFEDPDILVEKIYDLLASSFFREDYEFLNIGFWGGEPSMNMYFVKTVLDAFIPDHRVKFFIYSNGWNIDSYLPFLEEVKGVFVGGQPKIFLQVSYDGAPINDMKRKTVAGGHTSTKVIKNFERLVEAGHPTSIKSTITPDCFKYLYEAYKDIKSINGAMNYFPTIEYFKIDDLDEETFSKYKNDLKQSLIMIAKEEIAYHKTHGRFFFNWFTPNRAHCAAGVHMSCLSTEGSLYKCHGCLYNKNDEHKITTIYDESWIDSITQTAKEHSKEGQTLPEECKECEATYCLKCNVAKFDKSDKDSYLDKWTDYTAQNKLCDLYKMNGKIVKAMNHILK